MTLRARHLADFVLPDGALGSGIDRDARRTLVAGVADPLLDGIDFVEVLSNHAGTPGHVPDTPQQRTLAVHLLRGPVPDGLGTGPADPRVAVLGGVRPDPRVNPVRVVWAYPAVALAGDGSHPPPRPLAGVTDGDRALVAATLPETARDRVLVVRTSTSGDHSTYVLRLLGPAAGIVPAGFDEPLAQAPFTFTVDCPSDLDCRPQPSSPPPSGASPVLDYLARDYEALRTRLLDRLAVLLPEWRDRSPADIGVTLVELFAYLGDRLAYWQDSVAGEAYLSTARRRTSVRRHARLLDYRVHEGCSARTWLAFTTKGDVDLPRGTAVADIVGGSGALPPGHKVPTVGDALQGGSVVFETCAPVRLRQARNRVYLHAWGGPDHVLPAGSTGAFVSVPPGADLGLRAGDVLVLAELGPGLSLTDGDPTRRYAVRLDRDPVEHTDLLAASPKVLELHWHVDDALSGPLQVSRWGAGRAEAAAVAYANIVLADHGGSVAGQELDPPRVPPRGSYRPRLPRTGLAWADPAGPAPLDGSAVAADGWASATAALRPDPRDAQAQLELDDGVRRWLPRTDLLGSSRGAPHVVVEPEPGGWCSLRFGDNASGLRPTPGMVMTARYRLGGGTRGNVGSDTLCSVLQLPDGGTLDGISVTNPLPASGGADPESVEEVRVLAPHAFRSRRSAVTSADYAAVAEQDPAVRRAVARRRWTGSWFSQEVALEPTAAKAENPAVYAKLASLLESRRTAGVDIRLARVISVALEIRLVCCLAPGQLRPEAERQLRDSFSARVLPDGRRGLFHPDNLPPGGALYVSDLVATAMSVSGVTSVGIERFGRVDAHAEETSAAIARGHLDATPSEVLRCDSDPDRPESGRLDLVLLGGS